MHRRFAFCLLLLNIAVASLQAQVPPPPEPIFDLHRLSESVLVLTERSPMENNIIAIASERGLVVVDSSGSPTTAAEARRLIEHEFQRNDFAYLVNTHWHWDHAWGNQVFREAVVVGHEECSPRMRSLPDRIPAREERLRQAVEDLTARLGTLDPESEEAQQTRLRLAFDTRNVKGLAAGLEVTPPEVSFNDRMQLDLGDVTMQLIFFGRAHSGADILISIPEERLLLTGDLFLEKHWLPLLCGQPELDVDRWFEALDEVLDGEADVRHVVPGHVDVWDRARLDGWRNYFARLWDAVRAGSEQGTGMQQLMEQIPPPGERFASLADRGHSEQEIARFHQQNIRSMWVQLHDSAATVIGQLMDSSGIQAARDGWNAIRQSESGDPYIDESEFNALGYRYLQDRRVQEAISIFGMNVEAFPESWNVFDSLGEALMTAGNREEAIRNYRRSVELNPDNQNGIAMLQRLEAE